MRKLLSIIAVLMPPVLLGGLLAQSTDTAAQSPAPTTPAPTAFNPGVGELMNLIVQPRHTKLWLAGHEANWALAEYEIKELRSALANVAKARPVFRERSVAESVEMFMGGAFRGIDEAIKARDAGQVRRGLCDRERGLQRLSHRAQPISGRDQDAGAAVLSGPGIPRPEVMPSASW